MKKLDFNRNWTFTKEGSLAAPAAVTLPHDAMLHEERSKDAPGGIGSAYFESGRYIYEKSFPAPEEWKDQTVLLLFEGVYRNATVLVNGKEAAQHTYGYTPFTVELDEYLHAGAMNTITVKVNNADQPNSRWYSGAGIYRPVWILTAPKTHIAYQGIQITTRQIHPAIIDVHVCAKGRTYGTKVLAEVLERTAAPEENSQISDSNDSIEDFSTENTATGRIVATAMANIQTDNDTGKAALSLSIPDARLWSAEHPFLYTMRIRLLSSGPASDSVSRQSSGQSGDVEDKKQEETTQEPVVLPDDSILDEAQTDFGIRLLSWSARRGFLVNDEAVDLKGGCIHSDNGILGACEYDEAAMRRVRIMKKAGFNAIRSAHNPCSPALLRACDQLGMYIMDELFDMWYMAKNKYDYHLDFENCWQDDTRAMVLRDYNHPSVVLYSIGNEVSEPCEARGVETGRKMVEFIHSLDTSRPVTCGTNLMIISRAAKGIGIYQDPDTNADKKGGSADTSTNAVNAEKDSGRKKSGKEKDSQNASLMYNMLATFIGTGMNNAGNSRSVDKLVSPFCDCLDIAGYNYASGRYLMDGRLHPDRVIFGSETFPQDIYKNWQMIKAHPYLVGDFMWAGWDYLGEVGIGAWSYTGGLAYNRPYPWILAGSGVIDITGRIDASGRYASLVWDALDRPVIGVRPVNHPGVIPSRSVWRATNAIESWSWEGCDGNWADVEVYGHGDTAELILNGKSKGIHKLRNLKTMFHIRYHAGKLIAVIRNKQGRIIGRTCLSSSAGPLHISVKPEKKEALAGEIVYVDLALADDKGRVEANADRDLRVTVQGGELLGLGSANPCTTQRYDGNTFSTYYGRALAVVRSLEPGQIRIRVSADRLQDTIVTIPVSANNRIATV